MSETATGNQVPRGQTGQARQPGATDNTEEQADTLNLAPATDKLPAEGRREAGITAREIAAQHFARLLYAPVSTWSRYIFHENDPHPFGTARKALGQGRG